MGTKERLGWAMFTLSGVLFLISSLQAGDWLTITGALLWLAGCAIFLAGSD